MSLGPVPFEEIVALCATFLESYAKDVTAFYSETDSYGRKKVLEITVTRAKEEGSDETAGKSDKNIRTANPYS